MNTTVTGRKVNPTTTATPTDPSVECTGIEAAEGIPSRAPLKPSKAER